MRWTTPRLWEQRYVWRFAWLPVHCKNQKKVWLERYLAIEEYGKLYFWSKIISFTKEDGEQHIEKQKRLAEQE